MEATSQPWGSATSQRETCACGMCYNRPTRRWCLHLQTLKQVPVLLYILQDINCLFLEGKREALVSGCHPLPFSHFFKLSYFDACTDVFDIRQNKLMESIRAHTLNTKALSMDLMEQFAVSGSSDGHIKVNIHSSSRSHHPIHQFILCILFIPNV